MANPLASLLEGGFKGYETARRWNAEDERRKREEEEYKDKQRAREDAEFYRNTTKEFGRALAAPYSGHEGVTKGSEQDRMLAESGAGVEAQPKPVGRNDIYGALEQAALERGDPVLAQKMQVSGKAAQEENFTGAIKALMLGDARRAEEEFNSSGRMRIAPGTLAVNGDEASMKLADGNTMKFSVSTLAGMFGVTKQDKSADYDLHNVPQGEGQPNRVMRLNKSTGKTEEVPLQPLAGQSGKVAPDPGRAQNLKPAEAKAIGDAIGERFGERNPMGTGFVRPSDPAKARQYDIAQATAEGLARFNGITEPATVAEMVYGGKRSVDPWTNIQVLSYGGRNYMLSDDSKNVPKAVTKLAVRANERNLDRDAIVRQLLAERNNAEAIASFDAQFGAGAALEVIKHFGGRVDEPKPEQPAPSGGPLSRSVSGKIGGGPVGSRVAPLGASGGW